MEPSPTSLAGVMRLLTKLVLDDHDGVNAGNLTGEQLQALRDFAEHGTLGKK